MEPIFGFALYFAACLGVAVVASKRGLSGIGYFFSCLVAGFVLAVIIGRISTGMAAGFGAFVIPIAGLFVALSSKSAPDLAIEKGEYGAFRKCPFCAESVRKEAVKCKHCSSDLEPLPRTEVVKKTSTTTTSKPLAPDDMACFNCYKHIPKTAVSCAYCGVRYTPIT